MDTVLLQCFLAKTGDEQNQILLYSSRLIVVFKGKRTEFDNGQILNINMGQKKLIVALVLGGIGTSFSMLALSMGWYHYQLNLFAIFVFFGLMYYGFIGSEAVVVNEKAHEHIFLNRANKAMTGEFVSFVKERLWKLKTPIEEQIFHLVHKKVWVAQLTSYHFQHPSLDDEGFMHCSTREEVLTSYEKYFNPNEEILLVAINPRWVLSEVQWVYNKNRNATFPHIHGPLNKSAVLWVQELSGMDGLRRSIGSFG